ncbi:glycosyltransferase family 2 protein [Pseudomonadota bacterium]
MTDISQKNSFPKIIEISVVIPVFEEEETVALLHNRLTSVLERLNCTYELLFINDGSLDSTARELNALCEKDPRVGVVHFRRNFGKSSALDAGFKRARGRTVVTIDADLQDDPEELPRLLADLEKGNDVVIGWKKERNDPAAKTLPSRIFNSVTGWISGLRIHDMNSGLKVYRHRALEGLDLYGEMHRFIPVLLYWRGFVISEIPVKHHPRQFGESKYGWGRLVKGAFDLLTVTMETRYSTRPLHLFGGVGLVFGTAGFLILAYLTVLWFAGYGPIGNRPLLLLGLLLTVVGVQFVSMGLLGELVIRSQQSKQPSYVIREYRRPGRPDQ